MSPTYRRLKLEWQAWHLNGRDDESVGIHDVSTGARPYLGKRVFINDNNRQGKRRTICKMSPEMLGASKRCITGGADEGFDIVGHIVLYSGLLYSMDGGRNWTGRKLSGEAPQDPTQPSPPAQETQVQVQMQMQQSRFSALTS